MFVDEAVYPLLRLHQRYSRELIDPSSSEPLDLLWSFPRLVIFGLGKRIEKAEYRVYQSREKPLHITLYRPISLPDLIHVCLPVHGGGYENIRTLSFFGCFYHRLKKGQALPQIDFDIVRDIVGLTIKPGAYITRPAYTRDMRMWRPTKDGPDFELEIQGEGDEPGLEETVKMALAHLKVFMEWKKEAAYGRGTRINLMCTSSYLERFCDMASLPSLVISSRG